MKAAWSSAPSAPSHSFRITLAMLLGIGTTTGCGSSGPPTLLNNSSEVEVYVDRSTQQLNTQALAPGSTLRMDCAQVNDGVTATPQASSAVAVQGLCRA